MDKLVINGGNRLKGTLAVSGAKNAALPIMAAALMGEGPSVLSDVPDLADIRGLADLLGDAISRIHRQESVSSLFMNES